MATNRYRMRAYGRNQYCERQVMDRLAANYDTDKHYHREPFAHTGEWFMTDARVERWRDTNGPAILWLTGSAGYGKSILTQTLAEQSNQIWWRNAAKTTPHTTVCYYYFRAGYPRREMAAPALCALLHQLFATTPAPNLVGRAIESRTARSSGSDELGFEEMGQVFESCMRDSRTGELVVLLDALDECDHTERRTLLAYFGSLFAALARPPARESQCTLKLFLTSRPLHGELRRDFDMLRGQVGVGAMEVIDADEMLALIRPEMNPTIESAVKTFPEEQRLRIWRVIRENESRSWLWLRMVVGMVLKAHAGKAEEDEQSMYPSVDALLEDLPRDVETLYSRALDIASLNYGESLVEQLLHIILAARRPLGIKEVLVALACASMDPIKAVSASEKYTYDELAKQQPELASLIKELDKVVFRVYVGTVDFVHSSARDFLVMKNESLKPFSDSPSPQEPWKGRLNIAEAHAMATRACLSFLLTTYTPRTTTEHQDNNRQMKQKEKESPFLRYSAEHWSRHFRSQTESAIKATITPAWALCNGNGPEKNNWLRLYGRKGLWVSPGLGVAVYLGITPVVRAVLEEFPERTANVDTHGENDMIGNGSTRRHCRCMLYQAIKNRDSAVARMLFDKGWKLRPNCECNRSLSTSAEMGHADLVQIILDQGTAVKGPSESEYSPLIQACRRGHQDIVRILLARGANVNFAPEPGIHTCYSPLEVATTGGHLEIVRMLLDHGVWFRLYGIRALWDACRLGHLEIARLLLEKGLTPNVRWNAGSGSGLNMAVQGGHTEIVSLMLDHGAKVFKNDIEIAVRNGFEEIAYMLLDPFIALLLC
ncbi:ankyrin repeat-containing domain protein [Penicillium alfredii]|uniref:Ankyrin repeat-containing domain protein n=1 Tax=Penicillium alfredii TaxID=1506179 RepID=A0A9W9JZN3_9EURO|nr:ankyrin repeat-containing domain protein [Penicillium alfredii]KAJ5086792.1 ankyrin repeat-containing domain protein [Penicillium alfredii]